MALDPIQDFVKNMKTQIKNADKGVFRSSKEYKAVMKGVEELDRLVTQMVNDKTIDGRMQKIEAVRAQMGVLGGQIDAYMEHSSKKKSLNSKAKNRVNTLNNIKNQLGELRYQVDDKELEMDALKAHNDNVKIEAQEQMINDTKNLYSVQANALRGKKQLSAKGALVAANNLHKLARKSTGDSGVFSKNEVESVKKCVASMVLHEMMTGPNGDAMSKNMEPTAADYTKKVQQIAGSPEFKEAFDSHFQGKVTPESVHDFLTDYKNPKKLEGQFLKNIHKTAEKNAQKTTSKTTNKTVNKAVKKTFTKTKNQGTKNKGTKTVDTRNLSSSSMYIPVIS